MVNEWHMLAANEVAEDLNCDPKKGLDDAEVIRRQDQYGPNEIIDRGIKNPWKILLEQFTQTMVVILIIAAIISGVLGEWIDAIVILVIVVLNAILGFRQEYKAEQAMAALKKMAVPLVRVRRNGRVSEVASNSLVPGDVILLEAGNIVSADGRLLESINLQVQESALTGESEPISKAADMVAKEVDVSLGDRRNMVYMGTLVTYGRALAIVTSTGMQTELGKIADLMQTAGEEPTPLQKRLAQLGKGLALAAFVLVAIVFTLGMIRGEEIKELLLTSISIAVAAVPEGLPAVVTIALALGARRMLKRQALIRKLPAVEALGSVTVICSDKTGTLTENRMTVTVLDIAGEHIDLNEEELRVPFKSQYTLCYDLEPDPKQVQSLRDNPALTLMIAGGALCNDALLECQEEYPDRFQIVGDPTEGALVVSAARIGLVKDALEQIFPRVGEVPFDSQRKRMTTIHRVPDTVAELPEVYQQVWDWAGWGVDIDYVVFTKGAVDSLLEISDRVWVEDRIESLDDHWRNRIVTANENLAKKGMRVLGIGCRTTDYPSSGNQALEIEKDLIFVGLVGMIDPARPEVKSAVQTCRRAGIRPIMITGDHPLTARYIAGQLGIISNGTEDKNVVTGQELEQMSDENLAQIVFETSVYARVSPEHKLRIVESLQGQGQIAAMTGDGVNDAPALKTADIGVAMGITGTDVSKEAADMVLLDDNFATIVAAVEEGRVIYDNIRKFIQYTLSSNTGEIWVMLVAPFLGMPLPLLPLQILWINLVTDGLPGLALGVEKGERNTMKRPPYRPDENIFARGLGLNIIWIGILMGIVSLGVGFWYFQMGNPLWQTMVFTTLTLSEMGYVMAIRSNRDSVFSIGLFSNRSLIGAVVLTTALQLAVVYVPFLQKIFNTRTLPLTDLLICVGLSMVLFLAVEIQKWIIRWRDRNIDDNSDQIAQAISTGD